MPQPMDYFGAMGGAANIGGVTENAMRALFNEQNRQSNQNVLDQQARAEETRQALSVATDPNAAPEARDAGLQVIQRNDPGQAAALRAQMERRQRLSEYFTKPTAQGTLRLMTTDPDLRESLEKGWEFYSGAAKQSKLEALASAYELVRRGDTAAAAKIAREHKEADAAAGLDTQGYDALIEAVEAGQATGEAYAGAMLAAGVGPDKFAEAYGKLGDEARADELQPAKLRQENATASTKETEAQYAPQKIESELATETAQRTRWAEQTANEVARLALDRDGLALKADELQSTIQLKLEEMAQAGTQLDAGARQAVNAAVGASVSSQALADRASQLAANFEANGSGGWGWASSAREAFKGLYGGQDPITGLRNEYNQIVNQQAVKNLPPGPASDKDIQLAKQGFPPSSASKEHIVSFLRGMAKMQQAVAASEDRKANWISANGSLSPTRRDTNIGGVAVPAGTTFTEFNGNAVKRGRQGETPAGIQSIITKYGGR